MPLPDVQSNRGGAKISPVCSCSEWDLSPESEKESYIIFLRLWPRRYSMLVKETRFAFSIRGDSLYSKLEDHTEKRSIS